MYVVVHKFMMYFLSAVLKRRYGVDIVQKEWLLDTIGEYSIKDLKDYDAFSPSQ